MERAYYLVEGGKIREDAIAIQNEIEKQRQQNFKRIQKLAEEFGCSEEKFYTDKNNQITALIFEGGHPDLATWKRNPNASYGWIPKRNTKVGKELYKRIVGESSKPLDVNDAIPKHECFKWKISASRMYYPSCSSLPFKMFKQEDVVMLSLPFDEMKEDEPQDIPKEIQKHFKPIKASEYQAQFDRFNELAKKENNEQK